MGIFGGKTKTFGSSTGTSNLTAWSPVQGSLTKGADIMSKHLTNPGSNAVYDGPRVAPLSADTTRGIDLLRKSTGANDAMGFFKGIIGGGAGGMNPQVQAMQDQIRRQVMSNVASQFSNAGTVGGTANQEVLSRGLADGLSQPLFAAYENDMARKMQAANAMPGVGQQIINNQIGAGQIKDSYNQSKINADRQAFDERRTGDLQGLKDIFPMLQSLGTSYGTQNQNQQSTQTQKNSTGLGNQILGGLMMGTGMLTGFPGMGMMGGGLMNGGGGGGSSTPWTFDTSKFANFSNQYTPNEKLPWRA